MAALVPAVVNGIVREVIVVDGGSSDRTADIAEAAGARLVKADIGRGTQLRTGAGAARGDWLLFLHADTVLQTGWDREAAALMARVDNGQRPPTAAAFRFILDDLGIRPRLIETGVALRCRILRMPYGDQALLIPRRLYNQVGGYRAMPLMEDVDINRRLGRSRMVMLRSGAVTSAVRFKRDGYVHRVLRNWMCLAMFYCRVPIERIARLYG